MVYILLNIFVEFEQTVLSEYFELHVMDCKNYNLNISGPETPEQNMKYVQS